MEIKKQVFNILNILTAIPYALVLSTVFVVDHSLANGVVTGKYFWFYGAMLWVVLGTVVAYVLNRKKVSLSWIDAAVLIFSLVAVSLTYARDGSTTKMILLTLNTVLYFNFRIFIAQHKWNGYVLVLLFMLTGLTEAIWGLLQLYGQTYSQHGLFRTTGSFFNSGPYAGYLAVVLPVALYYLLKDFRIFGKRFNKRTLPYYLRVSIAILVFLSIILVLPATMSRASWLGAIGGCAVVAFFYASQKYRLKEYYHKHKKRIITVLLVAVTLLIAGGAGIYYMKKDSADGRALIWKISLQTVKEHPFGVGLGNFAGSYGDVQAEYFASGRATPQEEYVAGNPEYGFNEYLQLCIEVGIIPFLLFLGILIGTIISAVKREKFAPLGALIALLIFAAFSYPFNVLPFVIVFVFLLALCIADRDFSSVKSFTSNTIGVISILIFSAVIVTVCWVNRRPAQQACRDWGNFKVFYQAGAYEGVVEKYADNEPYLSEQIQFLFEYAQSLSKTGDYEESNRTLQKATKISCDPMLYNIMGKNYQALGNYDKAEENFIKAANIVPNRHYPYYLLAKLYMEKGDNAKAVQTARYIIEKEPKVPSRAIEEMKEEMQTFLKNEIIIP